MASIAPSERFRRELEDVIDGAGGEPDPIEVIGRLGARLILQQALEDELSEFLGRERYERRGEPVSYARARLADPLKSAATSFSRSRLLAQIQSRIWKRLVTRANKKSNGSVPESRVMEGTVRPRQRSVRSHWMRYGLGCCCAGSVVWGCRRPLTTAPNRGVGRTSLARRAGHTRARHPRARSAHQAWRPP